MTIPKFLAVIKITLYESFIDPMYGLFFKPPLAFIFPENVAFFFFLNKIQVKDEKFTHLTCSSHSFNFIAFSFLKNVSVSIFG